MNISGYSRAARAVCGLASVVIVTVTSIASTRTVGSTVLSGDAAFDSDSIADSENQHRCWVSYPGARLCLNPSSRKEFVTEPIGADLPLNVGGFLGTGVLRLPNVLSIRIADIGNVAGQPSMTRQTTWYPYKLGIEAAYAGDVKVSGQDFFLDAQSTLVRILQVDSPVKRELVLGGTIHEREGVRWDATHSVLRVDNGTYFYALSFVSLEGRQLSPAKLQAIPVVGADSWSLRIPVAAGTTRLAIGFGFSVACEGGDQAVVRVQKAFDRPVSVSIAATKAVMDGLLRRVPKPGEWGLHGINPLGVTPQQHRQAYYAAWAFLCQNVVDVQPENREYPYPQMTVGKPSLWAEGEKTCPATCGWESLLSLQWVSFLDPSIAWIAYEGIMTRVDADGMLGGESLPSRKAQTAWILYRRKPDLEKLQAVYPAIKRYLLWREKNLRWLYPGNDDPCERDMEFAVSWLFDIGYAEKIATALKLESDRRFWHNKREPLLSDMRKWFFSDPAKLHQFYFTNTGLNNDKRRNKDVSEMITTALSVKDMPEDMLARVKTFFMTVYNPELSIAGFESAKHTDSNLTAYGLIDRKQAVAKPYVQTILRDVIRAGDFGEVTKTGPVVDGVKPSAFNALTVIEFTWLLNGVRFESGVPVAFEFPGGGTI